MREVLVIGAGPAGLALGSAIKRRGIAVTILERDRVGSTWHRVPRDLRVLSPWWTNILDFGDLFRCNPFGLVPAERLRDHLVDFARKAELDVREGEEVTALSRRERLWQVTTRSGNVWLAKQVVCASGYFSSPWIPAAPFVSDGSIPCLHASTIEDYDAFAEEVKGRTVLLVGKRVTAGQLMVELCRRDVDVVLSARTPLEFRRSGWRGAALDQLYFFYETVRIRLQPQLRANSYPVMDGGDTERLIASGRVTVLPRLVAVSDRRLVLEDGSHAVADLVIFATGYRPALNYLAGLCEIDPDVGLPKMRDFELAGADGIFLVGFDNLRNFRSRYLRGIRSDAKRLSRIIAGRLGN
jgi:hypothetical protein